MWCLWLMLGANPSNAQSAPTAAELEQARVLFEIGRNRFFEGAYESAIAVWQEAYDLSKRTELLFNLHQAYEKLGRLDEAIRLLNEYRATVDDPEEAERLARKVTTLRARVAAQTVVDESPVPAPPPPERRPRSLAGPVLIGIGSAALVGGAILGVVALNSRAEARRQCVDVNEGWLCPDAADAAIRRANVAGTSALVSLVVGGAGAGVGVTLVVGGGKTKPDPAVTSVEPAP